MGRYHPYSPSSGGAASENINLFKLDTASLRRYRSVHQLVSRAVAERGGRAVGW